MYVLHGMWRGEYRLYLMACGGSKGWRVCYEMYFSLLWWHYAYSLLTRFIQLFWQATYKDMKQTKNFESYVQWFNRLSYFVATEICMVRRHTQPASNWMSLQGPVSQTWIWDLGISVTLSNWVHKFVTMEKVYCNWFTTSLICQNITHLGSKMVFFPYPPPSPAPQNTCMLAMLQHCQFNKLVF